MRQYAIIALLLIGSTAVAQKKIKYKDIFPLLEDKRYDQVEDDLRRYLSNDKNKDEGNPNYQMGLIMQRKFDQQYILSDTAALFDYADSASFYFTEAIKYIDDRELRKNDEYYQSFYRRDLRTGEFGIKLSDVHLDIEKLIEEVEGRAAKIRRIHNLMAELKAVDSIAISAFNTLVLEFDSYNDFLLSAGLPEITELGDLESSDVSIKEIADEIIKLAEQLKVDGIFLEAAFEPITDFATLPIICEPTDGTLESWDYGAWADLAKSNIGGEVAEYKRLLAELDKNLEDSKQELKNSILAAYPTRLPEAILPMVEKFDPNAAPVRLLKARMLENTYFDITDTIHNSRLGDTSYVDYQVMISDSLADLSGDIKKLTAGLAEDLVEAGEYYESFYNDRYGSSEEIAKYASKLNSWAGNKATYWQDQFEFWNKKNSWGLMPADSLPLSETAENNYDGPYEVWQTYRDRNEQDLIVVGNQKDTTGVFLAGFGGDRKLVWKQLLESDIWKKKINDSLAISYDTLISAEEDFAMYVFVDDTLMDKNLLVASFSKGGKKNWVVETRVRKAPVYNTYNAAIRQHTVFLFPKEEYPLKGEDLGYIVIDRNGEVR